MTKPTFTTDDTGRTSPEKADSVAFKTLFASSGVLGRETAEDAFNGPESAFMGSPNKSRCIHLENGGVVRESIPVIPDEEDDKREARA